jgi:hypothetical protein
MKPGSKFASRWIAVLLAVWLLAPSVAAAASDSRQQSSVPAMPAGCHESGQQLPAPTSEVPECCVADHQEQAAITTAEFHPQWESDVAELSQVRLPEASACLSSHRISLFMAAGPPQGQTILRI